MNGLRLPTRGHSWLWTDIRGAGVILALTALLLLLIGPLYAQQVDLRTTAESLAAEIVADQDVAQLKGQRLFIAEFKNINGKGDAVTQIFQEMLTTAFIRTKHFKVVERAQLEKALRELKITDSGLIDPDDAKKLGKMLGAGYMLVGSVSETKGVVSFDARLVAIETGESVTAAFASLGTPEAPDGATAPAPEVDVDQQANPATNTGTYLDKPDNFGLLGGTVFHTAWRTPLAQQGLLGASEAVNTISFCAGDVRGDGTQRLVTLNLCDTDGYDTRFRVWSWDKGKFRSIWESEELKDFHNIRVYANDAKSWIVVSGTGFFDPNVFQWDGITYLKQQTLENIGRYVTDRLHYMPDRLIGCMSSGTIISADIGKDNLTRYNVYNRGNKFFTIADFFDNGDPVLALVERQANRIEFFGRDGARKAITENAYGGVLTVWKPDNVKLPYLVAIKNEYSKDGDNTKENGGYVYLLQWDGEVFSEVWKSDKLDDCALDIQVCDPKNEGKDGLVVLSRDKKGCYLTKIVVD